MRYIHPMSDVIALPQDFQLVLRPNVSLSRDGFIILMMVFAAICLVAGGFFLAIGAWPVFGFFGLIFFFSIWRSGLTIAARAAMKCWKCATGGWFCQKLQRPARCAIGFLTHIGFA